MNPIALVRRGHFPFAESAKGKGRMILMIRSTPEAF